MISEKLQNWEMCKNKKSEPKLKLLILSHILFSLNNVTFTTFYKDFWTIKNAFFSRVYVKIEKLKRNSFKVIYRYIRLLFKSCR